MTTLKETIYTKDEANKKLFAEREFDAPVKDVWRAWTEPALLDQWWAPRPWKAVTVSMNFKDGGTWLYYMQGPDGTRHYCRADYSSIVANKSYHGLDSFCDEKGNVNTELPAMSWKVDFNETSSGTKIRVEITFDSLDSLQKIVDMGFKEGFAMAHNNLDELLSKGLQ
ncbi:MAG: SRPBCC family protein [Flavisolibacter sp.]